MEVTYFQPVSEITSNSGKHKNKTGFRILIFNPGSPTPLEILSQSNLWNLVMFYKTGTENFSVRLRSLSTRIRFHIVGQIILPATLRIILNLIQFYFGKVSFKVISLFSVGFLAL